MSMKNGMNPADLLKNWEERARGVYKETLHFVREGLHGLEVMAGKTVEVTKIRLANQQALIRLKQLFTDLGQRVYDGVVHGRVPQPLKLSPELQGFVEQITLLRKVVEENIDRLRHLTVISREAAEEKKTAAAPHKKRSLPKKKKSAVKKKKKK